MEWLFTLLIIEILLFFMAFLFSGQDIMAPSVMMTIMFIISTTFAFIYKDDWSINYGFDSTLILSSGIFIFIIAELFIKTLFNRKHTISLQKQINKFNECDIQSWIVIILIAFNVIMSFWYYYEIKHIVGGSGFTVFASYRRLGISKLANSEYESINFILNQLLKIVKASGYIAAFIIINNQICKKIKNRKNFGILLIVITSFLPSVMIASRAAFLMFFSAVLVEYYILWHQKNGWHRNLSWKYIRIGIVALVIGIPLFYYSLQLMGRGSTEKTMMEYVAEYIGGSIQLFDLYVKEPVSNNFFGEETLIGMNKILRIIGINVTTNSYNLEFRSLGAYKSNVYTFFRRPLHDYGIFGMYIFTIFVSMFFSWIYYGKIKWRQKSVKTDQWVLIYGYLYYWIILSSIDQYSQSYISLGAILIIITIVLGYRLITSNKIKFI